MGDSAELRGDDHLMSPLLIREPMIPSASKSADLIQNVKSQIALADSGVGLEPVSRMSGGDTKDLEIARVAGKPTNSRSSTPVNQFACSLSSSKFGFSHIFGGTFMRGQNCGPNLHIKSSRPQSQTEDEPGLIRTNSSVETPCEGDYAVIGEEPNGEPSRVVEDGTAASTDRERPRETNSPILYSAVQESPSTAGDLVELEPSRAAVKGETPKSSSEKTTCPWSPKSERRKCSIATKASVSGKQGRKSDKTLLGESDFLERNYFPHRRSMSSIQKNESRSSSPFSDSGGERESRNVPRSFETEGAITGGEVLSSAKGLAEHAFVMLNGQLDRPRVDFTDLAIRLNALKVFIFACDQLHLTQQGMCDELSKQVPWLFSRVMTRCRSPVKVGKYLAATLDADQISVVKGLNENARRAISRVHALIIEISQAQELICLREGPEPDLRVNHSSAGISLSHEFCLLSISSAGRVASAASGPTTGAPPFRSTRTELIRSLTKLAASDAPSVPAFPVNRLRSVFLRFLDSISWVESTPLALACPVPQSFMSPSPFACSPLRKPIRSCLCLWTQLDKLGEKPVFAQAAPDLGVGQTKSVRGGNDLKLPPKIDSRTIPILNALQSETARLLEQVRCRFFLLTKHTDVKPEWLEMTASCVAVYVHFVCLQLARRPTLSRVLQILGPRLSLIASKIQMIGEPIKGSAIKLRVVRKEKKAEMEKLTGGSSKPSVSPSPVGNEGLASPLPLMTTTDSSDAPEISDVYAMNPSESPVLFFSKSEFPKSLRPSSTCFEFDIFSTPLGLTCVSPNVLANVQSLLFEIATAVAFSYRDLATSCHSVDVGRLLWTLLCIVEVQPQVAEVIRTTEFGNPDREATLNEWLVDCALAGSMVFESRLGGASRWFAGIPPVCFAACDKSPAPSGVKSLLGKGHFRQSSMSTQAENNASSRLPFSTNADWGVSAPAAIASQTTGAMRTASRAKGFELMSQSLWKCMQLRFLDVNPVSNPAQDCWIRLGNEESAWASACIRVAGDLYVHDALSSDVLNGSEKDLAVMRRGSLASTASTTKSSAGSDRPSQQSETSTDTSSGCVSMRNSELSPGTLNWKILSESARGSRVCGEVDVCVQEIRALFGSVQKLEHSSQLQSEELSKVEKDVEEHRKNFVNLTQGPIARFSAQNRVFMDRFDSVTTDLRHVNGLLKTIQASMNDSRKVIEAGGGTPATQKGKQLEAIQNESALREELRGVIARMQNFSGVVDQMAEVMRQVEGRQGELEKWSRNLQGEHLSAGEHLRGFATRLLSVETSFISWEKEWRLFEERAAAASAVEEEKLRSRLLALEFKMDRQLDLVDERVTGMDHRFNVVRATVGTLEEQSQTVETEFVDLERRTGDYRMAAVAEVQDLRYRVGQLAGTVESAQKDVLSAREAVIANETRSANEIGRLEREMKEATESLLEAREESLKAEIWKLDRVVMELRREQEKKETETRLFKLEMGNRLEELSAELARRTAIPPNVQTHFLRFWRNQQPGKVQEEFETTERGRRASLTTGDADYASGDETFQQQQQPTTTERRQRRALSGRWVGSAVGWSSRMPGAHRRNSTSKIAGRKDGSGISFQSPARVSVVSPSTAVKMPIGDVGDTQLPKFGMSPSQSTDPRGAVCPDDDPGDFGMGEECGGGGRGDPSPVVQMAQQRVSVGCGGNVGCGTETHTTWSQKRMSTIVSRGTGLDQNHNRCSKNAVWSVQDARSGEEEDEMR